MVRRRSKQFLVRAMGHNVRFQCELTPYALSSPIILEKWLAHQAARTIFSEKSGTSAVTSRTKPLASWSTALTGSCYQNFQHKIYPHHQHPTNLANRATTSP